METKASSSAAVPKLPEWPHPRAGRTVAENVILALPYPADPGPCRRKQHIPVTPGLRRLGQKELRKLEVRLLHNDQ